MSQQLTDVQRALWSAGAGMAGVLVIFGLLTMRTGSDLFGFILVVIGVGVLGWLGWSLWQLRATGEPAEPTTPDSHTTKAPTNGGRAGPRSRTARPSGRRPGKGPR